MTPTHYKILIASFALFGIGGAYFAAIQPRGEWRSFSWHPFLMVLGLVGLSGASAVTKKLGGYQNTKLHGYLAWLGNLSALGGLYSIFQHKNQLGYNHFSSTHSIAGLIVIISCIGLGLVGGVVLHPDFGIDKTNKTIRWAHKFFARAVLMMAWFAAFTGLSQLTSDWTTRLVFAVPLLLLVPFTLL
jgi:hypothetical protein